MPAGEVGAGRRRRKAGHQEAGGDMTASQLNPSFECGEGMKVKVVKWC